jgi:PadR family transcriptional regulator, regulatory protein PadR
MKLEKELVAASTVPLVLAILEDGESYGYAIIARVRELSEGEIEWTDGMLYPVLHWLEEKRYVQTRWEKSEAGRKRKYYSLRTEGRKHLASHVAQWKLVHATLRRAWRIKYV